MHLSRRHVLASSAAWALGLPLARVAQSAAADRWVSFTSVHTGEHLEVAYWRADSYIGESLERIETVLRDHRTGDRHRIDPQLLDYLFAVATAAGKAPRFVVISGYRSSTTNERLRTPGSGVAQHSLHMQGRAIDVRLAGLNCRALADQALALQRGGVGYYRASNFVHLDTGPFRTWRG